MKKPRQSKRVETEEVRKVPLRFCGELALTVFQINQTRKELDMLFVSLARQSSALARLYSDIQAIPITRSKK